MISVITALTEEMSPLADGTKTVVRPNDAQDLAVASDKTTLLGSVRRVIDQEGEGRKSSDDEVWMEGVRRRVVH